MILRRLTKSELSTYPEARWNAFVDLVAVEPYEDLTEEQRVAHLAFWYDSEVQNGGHLQYFLNPAGIRASETVTALKTLGAEDQAMILSEALDRWRLGPQPAVLSAEDFVAAAGHPMLVDLDSRFLDSEPSIHVFLERYLAKHERAFLEFI